MNNEFLSKYRTALIMLLTIVITIIILLISWKNGNIAYLDRALWFFAGMNIFILCRNLIHTIKIDNKQFGISIEGSEKKAAESTEEQKA